MINKRQNIIWIASYPKSGNTWYRLFLSSLFNPQKTYADINKIDSTIIASSRLEFDKITGIDSSELTKEEIYKLRPNVYKEISSKTQQNLYIKVHDKWSILEDSIELFPEELTRGVIYIVRNPFDIVASLANHLGKSIDEAIHVLNNSEQTISSSPSMLSPQLSQHISDWSTHYRSWVIQSHLRTHVIKYEDLIINPIRTFRDSLEFLNLKYSETEVKTAINKCKFQTLQEQERRNGFFEKPLNAKSFFQVGKSHYGKKLLTQRQIDKVFKAHHTLLTNLKYS